MEPVTERADVTEEWKPIGGWEGLYEVSSLGRVRSLDRTTCTKDGRWRQYTGRVLRPRLSGRREYYTVLLCETGVGRCESIWVHILVLRTFIGPAPEGHEACHGPLGSLNNSLGNLRWDTRRNNILDRKMFGKAATRVKVPIKVDCTVCGKSFTVTTRRNAPNRICGDTCRSEWGRTCSRRFWDRRKRDQTLHSSGT